MNIVLEEGAYLPERAHDTDAGLDLRARETKTIYPTPANMTATYKTTEHPDNSATFDTGVHIELPHGWYGKIESKSGLNVNHGIVSCGGVIDEGYVGSIAVKLYNLSSKPYTVQAGDKIAQLVIMPYIAPEIEVVNELESTSRGTNGFGSTGR